MRGLTRQAKTLSEAQIRAALATVEKRPTAARDRAMLLLSFKAGFRAKEIASLTWPMVTDAEGNLLDVIALPNLASKGRGGGRHIPMNPELRLALAALRGTETGMGHVIQARGYHMRANTIAAWFRRLYLSLGFEGASSHSGRRTFITKAARKIIEAGGSLRDVQQLAGHASLSETQRYIEGNEDAKRRVVALI